jgi:hypothetical protein
VCRFGFAVRFGWRFVVVTVDFCLIFFCACCRRLVGIVVIGSFSLFGIVFCDLFPLVRLGFLVILLLSTLAHLGFSIMTFPSSVSALRFDVERVVVACCSSFMAECRGGLVCLGAVVVIAIG